LSDSLRSWRASPVRSTRAACVATSTKSYGTRSRSARGRRTPMTDEEEPREGRVVLIGADPAKGALWAPSAGLATEQLRALLVGTGELPDGAAFEAVRKSALRILA